MLRYDIQSERRSSRRTDFFFRPLSSTCNNLIQFLWMAENITIIENKRARTLQWKTSERTNARARLMNERLVSTWLTPVHILCNFFFFSHTHTNVLLRNKHLKICVHQQHQEQVEHLWASILSSLIFSLSLILKKKIISPALITTYVFGPTLIYVKCNIVCTSMSCVISMSVSFTCTYVMYCVCAHTLDIIFVGRFRLVAWRPIKKKDWGWGFARVAAWWRCARSTPPTCCAINCAQLTVDFLWLWLWPCPWTERVARLTNWPTNTHARAAFRYVTERRNVT